MAMKVAINEEALADPNYNPTIEPEVVSLYTMMAPTDANPDPVELIEEYEDLFLSLPTANVYSEVLVNPRQCDIADVREILDDMETLIGTIGGLLTGGDLATWDAATPAMITSIEDLRTGVTATEEHTDRLTVNLPTLVGTAQGAMGIATIIGALANPCAGLGNFLGSIMDKGKSLFDDLKGSLQPTLDQMEIWAGGSLAAVGDMISGITGALGSAAALAGEIAGMVADEIANFVAAMIGQTRMGLAEFLKNMKIDPCLAALAGTALTSAAAAVLG